jgi:hypothetical protein
MLPARFELFLTTFKVHSSLNPCVVKAASSGVISVQITDSKSKLECLLKDSLNQQLNRKRQTLFVIAAIFDKDF